MYLSRIKLDTKKRETMIALTNPQKIHGAIESALGIEHERLRSLWRIDELRGETYLLVLTKDMPNFSTVSEQFGYNSGIVETKDYDKLLNRITTGSRWRFKLTANPTKCHKTPDDDSPRGKITSLISVPYQEEWLCKRAEANGFSLSLEDFLVTKTNNYAFRKNGRQNVYILSVTFEGILTVQDADLFRKALTEGIGRGKAYGNGLLTVVQA